MLSVGKMRPELDYHIAQSKQRDAERENLD